MEPLAKVGDDVRRAEGLRQSVVAQLRRSGSPLAGRVRTVREWAAAAVPPEPAAWSSALPVLAALFPAGLPRGELVELVGRGSTARFGLVLGLLAAATSAGESAALVDLGDGLDPQGSAAEGVDLARLLWARPEHLKPALLATESLIGGGFPLVVLDLGLPPVPGGGGVAAHWLRLARAAHDARALLVVSTPYRVCGVAAPLSLVCTAACGRWRGSGAAPRLLDAIASRIVFAHGRDVRAVLGPRTAVPPPIQLGAQPVLLGAGAIAS